MEFSSHLTFSLKYLKYNPAGNVTALITSLVPPEVQPRVAATLLSRIGVEQVGFIQPPLDSRALVRLQMMGGEISANSLACLGLFLYGKAKGTSWVAESSGTDDLINLEVRIDTEVEKVIRIRFDSLYYQLQEITPEIYRVSIQGISHLIRFVSDHETISESSARDIVDQAGLTGELAIGVIYASYRAEGWHTIPYVFVPAVGSFIQEKACGTGAIALALILNRKGAVSEGTISIYQPSNRKLEVWVNRLESSKAQVYLDVPVQFIDASEIEIEIDGDY